MEHPQNKPPSKERHEPISIVSAILNNNEIVETVFDPKKRETAFAVWRGSAWTIEPHIQIDAKKRLIPYSWDNNLLSNEVVLLPSLPEEYESEEELIKNIQKFIHRHVDVSPLFEKIASYYVLFSWIYDSFNELPYLRLRGDPGSGKTRFLLIVGSLCNKPIFASGASTTSPLFRILDAFRGTLIIDESDFRMSDERAEVVKILNNGNCKGFPVLRSEVSPSGKEFNPKAYAVFGPKLIATRGLFEDRALESRFLTEEMGQRRLRDDIPINLGEEYKSEALRLRNQLLLFRFKNLHKKPIQAGLVDRAIEPRLNQIFVPLLSIIEDQKSREDLKGLARSYNRQMVSDRGTDTEAQILEIIRTHFAADSSMSVKDITSIFIERHQDDYERKVTSKWIGHLIRNKLHLKTLKSHGVFVIPPVEEEKLTRLYERYGIAADPLPAQSPPSPQVHPSLSVSLPPNVFEVPQSPPES